MTEQVVVFSYLFMCKRVDTICFKVNVSFYLPLKNSCRVLSLYPYFEWKHKGKILDMVFLPFFGVLITRHQLETRGLLNSPQVVMLQCPVYANVCFLSVCFETGWCLKKPFWCIIHIMPCLVVSVGSCVVYTMTQAYAFLGCLQMSSELAHASSWKLGSG